MIGADRFLDNLDAATQTRHVEQRYAQGYSDVDMWNMDVFIADVIVAACDWAIANGQTSPWKLETGEWRDILGEIRAGFSQRDDSTGAPTPPKSAWRLLRQNFKFMWD